jgi:hypothetical protein
MLVLHSEECNGGAGGVGNNHQRAGNNSKADSRGPGIEARGSSEVFVHPDGSVVLLPKLPVASLRGLVPQRLHPPTTDDIGEAAAAGAIENMSPRKRR